MLSSTTNGVDQLDSFTDHPFVEWHKTT